MKDYTHYPLLPHNTFGIEARCRRFIEIETAEEAQMVIRQAGLSVCSPEASQESAHAPLLIIGSGSNLLLTADFPGTVLHSAIGGIEAHREGDDVYVRAGSGVVWDNLVELCVANGWYGAENLSLIPGEVGASAVQNIGAYGAEAADIIHSVEAVRLTDGELVDIPASECGYGYRQSRFKGEWKGQFFITHVTYRLSTTFTPRLDYGNIRTELERQGIQQPTALQVREAIINIRRQKLPDPSVEGNAGSFFMNPVVERSLYEHIARQHNGDVPHYDIDDSRVKIPAAWLIDQCGWKGRTLGRAGVHSRQPLVLVNRGGATGADIVALCEAIRHDVSQRFGITLNPEVNIV